MLAIIRWEITHELYSPRLWDDDDELYSPRVHLVVPPHTMPVIEWRVTITVVMSTNLAASFFTEGNTTLPQ